MALKWRLWIGIRLIGALSLTQKGRERRRTDIEVNRRIMTSEKPLASEPMERSGWIKT